MHLPNQERVKNPGQSEMCAEIVSAITNMGVRVYSYNSTNAPYLELENRLVSGSKEDDVLPNLAI